MAVSHALSMTYVHGKLPNLLVTGAVQTFTAPVDGIYSIEVWGSSGGSERGHRAGKGGHCKGNVFIAQGTTLYVMVGQKGDEYGANYSPWNGGGTVRLQSSSGGGATDVRTISAAEGSTTWDFGLGSRIIVAGGGGGAGWWCGQNHRADHNNAAHPNKYGDGGDAGGLTGANAIDAYGIATGGTQTSGGSLNGGFGYGGSMEWKLPGSGGGGGWYGGGSISNSDGPGAGGSSYISGYPGCTKNADYVFTNVYMRGGIEMSNGHAQILLVIRQ